MKALILNSGLGHRMGVLTSEQPKCMTEISATETILSRQLKLLYDHNITDIVITTGYYDQVLMEYCNRLYPDNSIKFVNNPIYKDTNYIYSIYLARDYLDDDIILMHGDLVFEESVLDDIIDSVESCMKVSSTAPVPEKDFKAVVESGLVSKVGVEFFENVFEAQALYKLLKNDWTVWKNKIIEYCESGDEGKRKCYAEKALNEITDECKIYPLDVKDRLCSEIDTPEDLEIVSKKLLEVENRIVYMSFSSDLIHSGHIAIIKKAKKLGRLIIGILSDETVASYKRFPLLSFEERKTMFENIAGVERVVEQKTLSYRDVLNEIKPDYVVHGDEWKEGIQKNIRKEVIECLHQYGGTLVEYPYSMGEK